MFKSFKFVVVSVLALAISACGEDSVKESSYEGNFVNPLSLSGKYFSGVKKVELNTDSMLVTLSSDQVKNIKLSDIKFTKVESGKQLSVNINTIEKDGTLSKNALHRVIDYPNPDTIIMDKDILFRENSDLKKYISPYFGEYTGNLKGQDLKLTITDKSISFLLGGSGDETKYNILMPLNHNGKMFFYLVSDKNKKATSRITYDIHENVYFMGKKLTKTVK
jgi:hypothetical protein